MPFSSALLWAWLFVCGACQPFRPVDIALVPRIAEATAVSADFSVPGIRVEFAAQDSLERSLELFDSDLPRAGIHPVWVRIRNGSADVLQLEGARISLRRSEGGYAALAAPMRVIELLYKSYKTRLYSPYFRAQLERHFEQLSLRLAGLPPGQEASGYLFFHFADSAQGTLEGSHLRWSGIRIAGESGSRELEHTFPPR